MFLFAGLEPVGEDVAVFRHGGRTGGAGFTFYGAIVRWLDAFERTAQFGFTAAVADEFGFQFDSVLWSGRKQLESSSAAECAKAIGERVGPENALGAMLACLK